MRDMGADDDHLTRFLSTFRLRWHDERKAERRAARYMEFRRGEGWPAVEGAGAESELAAEIASGVHRRVAARDASGRVTILVTARHIQPPLALDRLHREAALLMQRASSDVGPEGVALVVDLCGASVSSLLASPTDLSRGVRLLQAAPVPIATVLVITDSAVAAAAVRSATWLLVSRRVRQRVHLLRAGDPAIGLLLGEACCAAAELDAATRPGDESRSS